MLDSELKSISGRKTTIKEMESKYANIAHFNAATKAPSLSTNTVMCSTKSDVPAVLTIKENCIP